MTTTTDRPGYGSLNVAGGTGLPVPLVEVTHTPRSKESTAPDFLRRPAAVLQQLDQADGVATKPQPTRNRHTGSNQPTRQRRTPDNDQATRRRSTRPGPVLDEAAIITAYRTGTVPLHALVKDHGTSIKRIKGVLTAAGVPLRKQGQRINYRQEPTP